MLVVICYSRYCDLYLYLSVPSVHAALRFEPVCSLASTSPAHGLPATAGACTVATLVGMPPLADVLQMTVRLAFLDP
jgi:hypothetical protein